MKLPSPLFAPFAHIFNLCSSHYRMQIKCNTCAIEYKVQSAKINCGVALLPTMQVGSQQNQFEWHTMLQKGIEGLIAEHMAITAKPRVEVLKTIDHFLWNGDETCFMVGADGRVRVVYGSKRRRNHELILTDSRFSITVYRCGNAAGVQGPFIFVMKCKTVPAMWTPEFLKSLGAPPGSMVVPSENAFMTDEGKFKSRSGGLWHC